MTYSSWDQTQNKKKKQDFMKVWESRDLGEAKEYLGMRITRDRKKRTLILNQIAYAEKVVKRFSFENAKPVRTPLPAGYNPTVNKAETTPELRSKYQSVIGSLLYIMLGTRPDLAFPVIKMSQFSANPSEEHLKRALYIVRYLASSKSQALMFNGSTKLGIIAFSDADWAMDMETRKSTTGYVIFLADGPISWVSRRQKTLSLSSTEAEYKAMSDTARQISWLKLLFFEIGFTISKVPMFCDNQGAIFLSTNPAVESRSKHIELKEHYIQECIEDENKLDLFYIETAKQLADLFTKNLTPDRFESLHSGIKMISFS